ncbi:MAG: hypothetical protein IT245_00295 [Bacteroidia bacterium]|nr:hypothetical protein [Bacteroidia bacterium]
MKSIFALGDKKIFEKKVESQDIAEFESGKVHDVYATFALGRDAEWSSRLFVLEMKEEDEEGIGTFLNIKHHSPAMLGDTVTFIATINLLDKNKVDCDVEVKVGERLIATCETGQKIIKKEKLNLLFESLRNNE